MHQPGLTLEPIQRKSYFNLFGTSGMLDYFKAQQIPQYMNDPSHPAYIPDPDPAMNCTQLVDAKNDFERRKNDLRLAAGAMAIDSLTVRAAFDREFSRKMALYDAAIQTCTPAPLPEIFAPTPTPTAPEPEPTTGIRLPTISEIKGGITSGIIDRNTSTLGSLSKSNNVENPAQQPETQTPGKSNNTKMALIIGAGVLLLVVITVIIIKKT